jgi:hypothetical protein
MAYTNIDKPDDYFNTVLYTGNGATNLLQELDFNLILFGLKVEKSYLSFFIDAVRGVNKLVSDKWY